MRKNKPNSRKKNKVNDDANHHVRQDVYLPRTESSLDILYSFDDIEDIKRRENADQVWGLTEEDFTDSKEYKPPRKLLHDVTALSTFPSNELVFCEVCSPRGDSEDKDSSFSSNLEDAECEITAADLAVYSSHMETVSRRSRRPNYCSKRTETTGSLEKFKSRTLFDDKEPIHHSKDSVARINKDNQRTAASLPLLQTPRQEKAGSLSGNKPNFKGRKQGSKTYDPDIGIVNGTKLSNSIAPEFQNLRHFLPLLTLCQCPDYDSAVIEVVRDYNDPCRGVASHIYPPH